MKHAINYLSFQLGWYACVKGAGEGQIWIGPLVVAGLCFIHLIWIAHPAGRHAELRLMLLVLLIGMLSDSALKFLGATRYPSSHAAWPYQIPPPWIGALWVLFGTLLTHSLRWLAERPWLALLLGAVGGPLSYLAGVGMGAVAVGDSPLWTYGWLSLEYALLTPLLLSLGLRAEALQPAPSAQKGSP